MPQAEEQERETTTQQRERERCKTKTTSPAATIYPLTPHQRGEGARVPRKTTYPLQENQNPRKKRKASERGGHFSVC